jgi:hypothetical protein
MGRRIEVNRSILGRSALKDGCQCEIQADPCISSRT